MQLLFLEFVFPKEISLTVITLIQVMIWIKTEGRGTTDTEKDSQPLSIIKCKVFLTSAIIQQNTS